MRIWFDFQRWEQEKLDLFLDTLSQFETELLVIINDFYYSRISVLKDKIDYEDKLEGQKCIIVHLAENIGKLSINGYSEDLTKKIESCFNEQDYEYLTKLTTDFAQSRLN